jgi:siroheme synthase (precorrin-2 oxidase/ferrochelatase)
MKCSKKQTVIGGGSHAEDRVHSLLRAVDDAEVVAVGADSNILDVGEVDNALGAQLECRICLENRLAGHDQ